MMPKPGKKNFRFFEKEVIEFLEEMRKDKYKRKTDINISEILKFNLFVNFRSNFLRTFDL